MVRFLFLTREQHDHRTTAGHTPSASHSSCSYSYATSHSSSLVPFAEHRRPVAAFGRGVLAEEPGVQPGARRWQLVVARGCQPAAGGVVLDEELDGRGRWSDVGCRGECVHR